MGTGAGRSGGTGVGVLGSVPPLSSRKGGYLSVISAAYAATRTAQRSMPRMKSYSGRGYRPVNSRTMTEMRASRPISPPPAS